jgi:hypothetical protein
MSMVPRPLLPREEGQRMLHNPMIDHVQVAIHPCPDDPDDGGNAFARAWHAVRIVLIPVGVGLGVFAVWVAALLLSWLF